MIYKNTDIKYKIPVNKKTSVVPNVYKIPPTAGPIITANSETEDIKAEARGKISLLTILGNKACIGGPSKE